MKKRLKRFQARMVCHMALGIGLSLSLVVWVNDADAADPVPIAPAFSDANWMSMGGIPGLNGEVVAAVVVSAGDLFTGGNFTAVGDVVANRIAKWDGSSWTALASGMNGDVLALAVSGSDL